MNNNTKMSLIFLGAGLILTASSFVGSHSDIKTFNDLFQLQNFFGLLGSLAGGLLGWLGRSPITPSDSFVAKVTGNGTAPITK